MKRRTLLVAAAALAAAGILGHRVLRGFWGRVTQKVRSRRTVANVLDEIGPAAEGRLRPHVERAGAAWPPPRATLIGFKQEKRLELWAAADGAPSSGPWPAQVWIFIRSYPILAASGRSGPKLREGDRQVPEGVYRLAELNPNSSYHLSMRVGYPNEFDRARAAEDGRTNLGGDIYIHGNAVSIGCLAMGDEAIEELFLLAARTGMANVEVILAPNDLRGGRPAADAPAADAPAADAPAAGAPAADAPSQPPWVPQLYDALRQRLREFPRPAATP